MSLNSVYIDDFEELLDDNEHNHSPLILLMGPRGSGKTSIQRVLFNKLSPHETNFVEHTTAPYGMIYPPPSAKSNSEALLRCRIIDFPGNTNFQKHPTPLIERLLQSAASIVYVVDASFDETWAEASENLIGLLSIVEALGVSPFISVLLHKIDPDLFSNDSNRSSYTDLRRALIDDLRSSNVRQSVTFYVTSLFDASIYETFSRIIQQLVPQVNLLEHLLDGFNSSSGMERVFLVDLQSKLYLATDSSTPDVTLYELLSDLLDMVFDLCSVFSPITTSDGEEGGGQGVGGADDGSEASRIKMPTSSAHSAHGSDGIGGNDDTGIPDDSDCFNAEIELSNSYTLHLRQFNGHLALLFAYRKSAHQQQSTQNRQGGGAHAASRNHNQHNNSGLVEYNVTCLKQAISALFNINAYGVPRSRKSGVRSGSNLGFGGDTEVNYGILSYMGSMASTNTLSNMKNLYSKVGTYGAGSVGLGGMSYVNNSMGMISSPSNGAFPVGSSRAQGTVDFSSGSYQQQNNMPSNRQNGTAGSYSGLGSLPMVNHTRQHHGGAGSYTSPQRK